MAKFFNAITLDLYHARNSYSVDDESDDVFTLLFKCPLC